MEQPPFDTGKINHFGIETSENDRWLANEIKNRRMERVEAAKQIYNELSEEHLKKYQENAKKKPIEFFTPRTPKELEERQKEIDQLQERLQRQQNGFGGAQKLAKEEELLLAIQHAEEAKEELLRQQIDNERYERALFAERLKEQEKSVKSRNKRINEAKRNAKKLEEERLRLYQKEQQKKAEEIQKRKEEELNDKSMTFQMPPLESFPKTFYNEKIGYLPVNVEALEYDKVLKKKEEETKLMIKKRNQRNRARTKNAAFNLRCEKNSNNLVKELRGIKKYEIDEQLEIENLRRPAKSLGFAKTYLVDDNYERKHEAANLFLVAPEAPAPRKPAPNPIPMHILNSSPVPSDNED